ncbi:hypothetical protein [Larkinella rosea]|uniref:Uncharacterized protein n=1 Tax=Larkinella rosea TaxID=2025312 RepID=A0A3P1BTT5_9BACT|nr:hypothetical protein [Larkinella rosea]RRB04323.1 hypothetical protein EHT25_12495 [Larkinella rosea]
MKNRICILLAKLLFNHQNFDFLEYAGLDDDEEPKHGGDYNVSGLENQVGHQPLVKLDDRMAINPGVRP